jgi:hypothetical protein
MQEVGSVEVRFQATKSGTGEHIITQQNTSVLTVVENGVVDPHTLPNPNPTPADLPIATTAEVGTVKPDGTTITVDQDGTIHGASSYTLPTATTSRLGGVKVDGTSIVADANGVISAPAPTIDSALSKTSTNAVQNKVIAEALTENDHGGVMTDSVIQSQLGEIYNSLFDVAQESPVRTSPNYEYEYSTVDYMGEAQGAINGYHEEQSLVVEIYAVDEGQMYHISADDFIYDYATAVNRDVAVFTTTQPLEEYDFEIYKYLTLDGCVLIAEAEPNVANDIDVIFTPLTDGYIVIAGQYDDNENEFVGPTLTKVTELTPKSGGGSYTLPTASASTLGGIKVGAGLAIDANGVLSVDLTNASGEDF